MYLQPMSIRVERFVHNADASASLLFIDNVFECFVIEDEPREKKVANETRISAGSYAVTVRQYGDFHERYSRKFGRMHQGMLELVDVPDFTDILVHCGNYEKDTAGCLLVNQGCTVAGEVFGTASVAAYKELYQKVIKHAQAGMLTIQIVDRDLAQLKLL